ncbi:MAG: Maf family protein [Alphaproteobacteria bacterium]|nr:Maf family protein [Alphaproteobacteria bacterium]
MKKHSLILASASPRRLELLQALGLAREDFEIVPASIDETPLKGEKPRQLAQRLAYEKGQVVALSHPQAYVLAADTVVACGRRIIPKAESQEDIKNFLKLLAGRRHHVYTAVALFAPEGRHALKLSDSTVIFKPLMDSEIEAYAALQEGLGKAGGYAIQGQAAKLIRFISGSYSGIVGLPLYETALLLKALGFTP